MIHASSELLAAYGGVGPALSDPAGPGCACGAEKQSSNRVFAFLYDGAGTEHAREDLDDIDCPKCLAALALARGPERTAELLVYADHLEGVVAAYDHEAACRLPTEESSRAIAAQTRALIRLKAIRAANLFVPGSLESAARRKTA